MVRNMQFSDDCRSHALVLMEIANVSPKFKEQALALAETWLTLANIGPRVRPAGRPSSLGIEPSLRPQPSPASGGGSRPNSRLALTPLGPNHRPVGANGGARGKTAGIAQEA